MTKGELELYGMKEGTANMIASSLYEFSSAFDDLGRIGFKKLKTVDANGTVLRRYGCPGCDDGEKNTASKTSMTGKTC